MRHWVLVVCGLWLAVSTCAVAQPRMGEDGYELWLRYRPVEAGYVIPVSRIHVEGESATLKVAGYELHRGLSAMAGHDVPLVATADGEGTLVVQATASPNAEGYEIRTEHDKGVSRTFISGSSDVGALYGAFRYLSLIQKREAVADLNIKDAPTVKLRVLNHWDNLDGSVERGYAGRSIFDWWRLPDLKDPRLTDYARANASIGINGVVVNNVNAKADSLTKPYIDKAAALADIFRPYGIKLYLSARFSAPIEIGGLKTADPLDHEVIKWWRAKTEEIYASIPDFGGFLVKASSEGQPGPGDYGRAHADGANMLAADVAPHGGIIMWRAFVYAAENPDDRAKQAYADFQPLDGKFAPNVLVQIKNGPIDFQPREPFHPLFGAMPHTNEMLEVQLTKEYLGQGTHLVYQGPLYEETLQADTFAQGKGSSVARIIDGSLDHHSLTGMAGVANIGSDRNWTGSDFAQSDWYAFGRLAWNPNGSAKAIATDWVKLTFSNDPAFVAPVVDMMMASRETAVHYMTPLGLAHQMATGHHYGPGPWVSDLARPEWNPVYYARADKGGIGFDRTRTGSNALSQYAPLAAKAWADPNTIDERYLLWFHHVPWTKRMKSGRTLWDELVVTYDQGAKDAGKMQAKWAALKAYVDPQRFEAVSANLAIQAREAKWWRDASLAYFQSKSGLPLPQGVAAPERSLDAYEALKFPYAPGQAH